MKERCIIAVISLFLMAATGMAQDNNDATLQLTALQTNFEQFAKKNPQERVYLHFDNTSYYKGEHIWYKAYVVEGSSLQPTNLSRILYVELVNPIGLPVETQKLVVNNGQASGSFLLKDTLNAGFYEVRAYTSWMLNFCPGNGHGWSRMKDILKKDFYMERVQHYLRGNAGIFSRVFPIFDAVEKGQYAQKRMPRLPKVTSSIVDEVKDKLKIDFYPEGGNLVSGIPTRVAFQAHSTEGRTLNIEGKLLREGKEIGTFKTDYGGRGVFSVTCEEGDEADDELTRSLRLLVNYEGKNYTFHLPKSHRRGYVLNVFSSGNILSAHIARNAKTPAEQVGLSITSRGTTLHSQIIDLRHEEQTKLNFSKSDLMTGVNIFTLYNKEGKVIAQREVFVNNHDMEGNHLKVLMPENGIDMQPYKPVTIQCQLVDKDGQPVRDRSKMSIAITDGEYRDGTFADDNMLTYLLLSSEVKGFIPHPEYYFEKDDAEHRAALDQLLMVQGWTRYDFERMMSSEPWEPLMVIERGLNFRGRLVDDKGHYNGYDFWKRIKKPLWIYNETRTPYDGIKQAEIKTDSLGFFMFNINPFYGTSYMTLMVNEESAEKKGHFKAGLGGHLFSKFKKRHPLYLIDKHIIPLNPYSPVARNFDYYETKGLDQTNVPNTFKQYMARNTSSEDVMYYDRKDNAWNIQDIKVKGRRRWSESKEARPVAVIDVRELMTYLSNIFGSINDFHYFNDYGEHKFGDVFRLAGNYMTKGGWWNPGAERDSSYQSNFGDSVFFANSSDLGDQAGPKVTPTPSSSVGKINSKQIYNRLMSHKSQRFDMAYSSFYNYMKLLLVLGLDGMNYTVVDDSDVGPYTAYMLTYGQEENLPENMKFFPSDVNFSKLCLYADTDDRSLIHQESRYQGLLNPFNPEGMNSSTHPLTSIIEFKTDPLYPSGMPEPDLYGFRINFQGLSEPDEFYRVDYSREPLPKGGDYRRTLYWNPYLTTDSEGCARVTFYNNSFSKSIAVSAEGMDKGGFIVSEQ
ncbi:MAG: hypothetical protein J6Y97_03735 [Prevotella sp.]|nr:hypothetical protein [Prevotella sp.]